MKIFLTGATGFIGGHVARKLRERDDEVVALVRSPEKGEALRELGCALEIGDLADVEAIESGVEGCDAVIHAAAIYKVGIPKSEHPQMYDANVRGTERVLRAALAAETPKVVYVSTIAAFGNTAGKVVDESYQHPGTGFTSYYEQTKYEAHQLAKRLIAEEGLPCVLIQPGGVYGPDDHSELGNLISQYVSGKLPLIPFPELGIDMVHVEDVADGILLGLDKGKIGEAYVLGGQITTNREILQTAAEVAGKKRRTTAMPTVAMKAIAPFGPLVGPLLGFPPNIGELVSSGDGVTFWAKHDKAMAELGYSPRGLESTLRDTMVAEGHIKP
jgi:dihydroflavonol-4-reductase